MDARDSDFMRGKGGVNNNAHASTSVGVRAVYAVWYKSWDSGDVVGLQPCFGDRTDINFVKGQWCFKFVELH